MADFEQETEVAQKARWWRCWRGWRGWRWAAMSGLAVAIGATVGSCQTPEFLKDPDETQPIKMVSAEGLTTEEVIYRGWDHCYRVSDGAVELIFVPSVGRLMRFSPVAEALNTPLPGPTDLRTSGTDTAAGAGLAPETPAGAPTATSTSPDTSTPATAPAIDLTPTPDSANSTATTAVEQPGAAPAATPMTQKVPLPQPVPTPRTPLTAPATPTPPETPAATETPATPPPPEPPAKPAPAEPPADDNAPPPMGAMGPMPAQSAPVTVTANRPNLEPASGSMPAGMQSATRAGVRAALTRQLAAGATEPVAGPTPPPTPEPTPNLQPVTADSRDSSNLLWVNPKWTGINPPPIPLPFSSRPREYPLYGGVSHWPGPQEKWPTTRAPDLRKLIDVDVNWPPEPGADLVPFTFQGGSAGKVWFRSAGISETGLQGSITVQAIAANKGVIDIYFAETNVTQGSVEAASWMTLPLRTAGYLCARRDQLEAEPKMWPQGTTFSGPWALMPLDARAPRGFELQILPAPGTTGHLVVLQGDSVFAMHAQRPATGEYAAGRTTMTVRKGVIGCPPQVDLVDPENELHFTVAASSTLKLLKPAEAVELRLRLVSKVVHNFGREQLADYLAKAVATETIRALPAPVVEAPPTGPIVPTVKPAPPEEFEIAPPLPDGTTPPDSTPRQPPPPARPPVDPKGPPPMGPVSS